MPERLLAAKQDGTWGCRSHFAAEDEGQSQMKPKCSVSKSMLLTLIPGTGKEEGKQGGEEAGDPACKFIYQSNPRMEPMRLRQVTVRYPKGGQAGKCVRWPGMESGERSGSQGANALNVRGPRSSWGASLLDLQTSLGQVIPYPSQPPPRLQPLLSSK